MKTILLAILLLYTTEAAGQFTVVQDNDGFVYVRKEAIKGNNIIGTLKNGKIVWCFEPKRNWYNVDFKRNGQELRGYIYKDRVKFIRAFDSIPVNGRFENELVMEKDSIKVEITVVKFDPTKNKLGYGNGKGLKNVTTINGKAIFGTDGEIPKRMYQSIGISIGRVQINLGKAAIENLFEPNLGLTACYADKRNDILYLATSNSDGAGAYEVLWVIEKGSFKERVEMNSF